MLSWYHLVWELLNIKKCKKKSYKGSIITKEKKNSTFKKMYRQIEMGL